MTIRVKPELEAVLVAQVEAGKFSTVDEALEAAILALDDRGDVMWAKPLLDDADRQIAAGLTKPHIAVWSALAERLGKP